MRFDTNHCLQHCFWHHLLYVHAHDYMNMMQYKLSLPGSTLLFKNNIESSLQIMLLSENNKHVLLEICQIEAESFYMLAWKQDHEIFTIIMKNIKKVLNLKSYIDSWLFISEKYHNLINVFEKKKTNKLTFHQKKYILKLIWNQTKCQNLNHCTACYEKNCKYYINILINNLQKNSFNQVIFYLFHLCCLSRNQKKNYISVLIIKHWT